MAESHQDPNSFSAPGAEEPIGATEEVVEAELIETEHVETTLAADAAAEPEVAEPSDPAARASESLAAAAVAAAAAATTGRVEASASESEPVTSDWQMAEDAPGAQPQYVVVEAPQVPARRGNRGIGALLAVVGAVIFGGVLVGVAYLLEFLAGRPNVAFLQDWHFYLPIIIFFVVFVLLVLLVNRAGWWSYILGSFIVALAVYFGTAGGGALIDMWTRPAVPHTTVEGLTAPFVILAALLAREVAVWWGSLIAYRGKRVTARNRAEREAFERDLEEFRARYGN